MTALLASAALLPDGWAQNVRITVDKGRIAAIEKNSKGEGERLGIVIPGMANVHSHVFQFAMRGETDKKSPDHPNDDFWTWRDTMYDYAGRIGPAEQQALAAYLYGQMLKAGYTSVAEFHYLHNRPGGAAYDPPSAMSEAIIEGAKEAGIALLHLPTLYQQGGCDGRKLADKQMRFFQTTEGLLAMARSLRRHESENMKIGIAAHSLRAVSAQELKILLAHPQVKAENFPIHLHMAEQEGEVEECREIYGKTPISWLLEELQHRAYEGLDVQRLVFIHATHTTPQELALAREAGIAIGYCPSTEAHLGDGISDAAQWVKQGGAWGIGTDENAAINPFAELGLAEAAQRLKHRRRLLLSDDGGNGLWIAAAKGGAKANGFDAGEIAVGKRADLLVLDESMFAHLAPSHILDAAILSPGGGGNPVKHAMAGGQWVCVSGRLADPSARAGNLAAAAEKTGFDRRIQEGYDKALATIKGTR